MGDGISSFLEQLYYCDCLYDCLFKYVCGIVSCFFFFVYGKAAVQMKINVNFNLDQEDKLLLYIALGITFIIFSYHVLYTHYLLLLIYRLSIILQQLTILFILAKLTLSRIKVMKSFWISLGAELAIICGMLIVTIVKGSEDYLYESSVLWYGISGLSLIISVVSFLVGFRLIQKDPRFKSYNLNMKMAIPTFNNTPKKSPSHHKDQLGFWLDFSEDSIMVNDDGLLPAKSSRPRRVEPSSSTLKPPINKVPLQQRRTSKLYMKSGAHYDVNSQFEIAQQEELILRRNRLFTLNITSCVSIFIMLIVDIYLHVVLDKFEAATFTVSETIVVVCLRVVQQNLVNSYLYYMLYWPYRYQLSQPKGFDMSVDNDISELSIICPNKFEEIESPPNIVRKDNPVRKESPVKNSPTQKKEKRTGLRIDQDTSI